MKIEELNQIEVAIGITLPKAYRELMANYPFSERAGNSDSALFDDKAAIIDLNKKYHTGFAGLAPWPGNLLFIGDDGAASCYAMDVSDPSLRIVFLDHGNVSNQRIEADSLAGWVRTLSKEADAATQETRPVSKTQKVLWLIVIAMLLTLLLGALAVRVLTGKPL